MVPPTAEDQPVTDKVEGGIGSLKALLGTRFKTLLPANNHF